MSYYSDVDIETDDGGEIILENGDLKLATARRSHIQAVNWSVLTNREETIHVDAVASLLQYHGAHNNARNRGAMELAIRQALMAQRVVAGSDVKARVVSIDINKVFVRVEVFGTFLGDEDLDMPTEYQILSYIYQTDTGVLEVYNPGS